MGILHDLQSDLEASAVRLFSEYHDRLFAEAKGMGVNRDEAEDLVMVAFESFFAKRDRFNPKKGDIFAYLRGILHNAHKMSVRKIGRRIDTVYLPMEDLQLLSDKLVAGEVYGSAEDRADDELVRQAIASLSPKVREAIMLHYFEEKSVAETAQKLGISENAVKNRLFSARKALAKKLKGRFGKALAILGICFLGFGVFAAAGGLSLFQSEDQSATLPEAVPVEAQVATPAELEEPPRAEPIAPTATFENNENTETKEEEPMKLTKTLKTAAVAAVMTISAVNSAEAEGEEYLLTVNADAAGQVQVTANGEKGAAGSSVELSLTNGSPVIVEYIPNVAGQGRFFTGAPASADVSTLNKISFAMAGERTINVSEFAYSDDYVFSTDATVVQKNPYEGRVVYVFTNTASSALLYARVPLYYEEALSVAGGGGGSGKGASYKQGACGGGGAGGFLVNSSARGFVAGASLSVKVGAGGAANAKGQNTTFALGDILLECIGGGAANSWQANSPATCNGGSGGGCGNLSGGSGTPGQGFAGGPKNSLGCGSGGGGASAEGGAAVKSGDVGHGGNGGDGCWDAISGELHCYASGGGGWAGSNDMDEDGNYLMEPGLGGAESGGRAGVAVVPESNPKGYTLAGQDGVDGLGGGGGGGYTNDGGAGGDGAVIVAFSIEASPEKRFSFDEFTSYPLIGAAAEPSPEIRCGETVLTKGTDYELCYENNASNGARAKMVIVGKNNYAGVVVRHDFRVVSVCYVKSAATSTGDGSTWANATTLEAAFAGLAAGGYEIWCAAGEYDLSALPATGLAIPCMTAIRGGFAADDADIAKKEAGAKSIFNGGGVAQKIFDVTVSFGAAYFDSKQILFEDCTFTGVANSAIRVYQKATPITVNRCVFTNNTTTIKEMGGVLNFYECSKAPITIADCVFRENYWDLECGSRRAVLFTRGVELAVDRCIFEQNCKRPTSFTATTVWAVNTIIDLYGGGNSAAQLVTADIRDCAFQGNFISRQYGDSRVIDAAGYVNANIERCRFVGNSFLGFNYNRSNAIINSSPNANYKVSINNCTFAYNALNSDKYNASVIIGASTANSQTEIKNCIFWGNRCREDNAYKRDLHLGSAATVQYCLFEDTTNGKYVNIDLDETNIAGDPKFVSGDVMDELTVTSSSNVILNKDKLDDIFALDVHLCSPVAYSKNDGTRVKGEDTAPLSLAIDKGDPAADYSNEPGDNGQRLNLGAYGNTAEASETPFCAPAIVSVTPDYPDGFTQLRLSMEVGGEGAFVGTVVFYFSTDGGDNYTASEPIGDANKGDIIRWSTSFYLEPNTAVKYYATLSVSGFDTITTEVADTTVAGVKPPWEKPGNVALVTPEGTPTGSGLSWSDALDLATAIANFVKNPEAEIWCAAGEYDLSALPETGLALPQVVAIRGGFAADDADIARKAAGAKSIFNGGGVAPLIFDVSVSVGAANFESKQILFEDCAFTGVANAAIRAYQKATPVTINRCVFTNNTTTIASMGGVLNFYECSKAPITIADCVFRENYWDLACGDRRAVLLVRGVKLSADRCVFEQNCRTPTSFTANTVWTVNSIIDLYGNDQWSDAIAVDADIRDCVFQGNFIARQYGDSRVIDAYDRVNANIERCRFVGNSFVGISNNFRYNAVINSAPRANYKVSINNCTFAYNALNNDKFGMAAIIGASTANSLTEIKNCIFWGNRCREDNTYKRDLHLGSAATVQYCLFEDTTKDVCVNIDLDSTNIAGDPAFVSGDVMDDLTVTSGSNVILNKDKLDEILALDVHLLSPAAYSKNDGTRVTGDEDAPLSLAIDKGDPEADYSNEPGNNGQRLNLGAYGNTAEASETPLCAPAIVSVTPDYPDGLTQLRLSMEVGGEGAFVGTVVFYLSTDGGATYTASGPIDNAKIGDIIPWSSPFYAEPGAVLKYYATLSASGADPVSTEVAETTVAGKKPPWEKPGDVALVTPEGTPTGSGQSWSNAIDLATAIANLIKHPESEIWCAAGEYDLSALPATGLAISYVTAIRGGFAADDADIAKKEAEAKSLFNGGGIAPRIFNVTASVGAANFESKQILFEDCAFTGVADSAIRVYQKATPVTINRCVFTNNTMSATSTGGMVCLYECSKAPMTVTNSIFRENYWDLECGSRRAVLLARGVKLAVDCCVFEQNCKRPTAFSPSTVWTENFIVDLYGGGNDSSQAVNADIRNCVFQGNFISRQYGAARMIDAAGYVNANIEHCRFVGNSFIGFNYSNVNTKNAIINSAPNANYKVAINNCTFAYNALNNDVYGASVIIGASTADSKTEIKNCIFWGNRCRADNAYKRDLQLGSAATVKYCLFEDKTLDKYVNIELDETNIAGDPKFISGDVMGKLTVTSGSDIILNKDKLGEILALDVHLERKSPAVNKGDPKSDWSLEPVPNGKRINMGAYGGTPEAACTRPGGALIIR